MKKQKQSEINLSFNLLRLRIRVINGFYHQPLVPIPSMFPLGILIQAIFLFKATNLPSLLKREQIVLESQIAAGPTWNLVPPFLFQKYAVKSPRSVSQKGVSSKGKPLIQFLKQS